jgi:hypothetical protein
VLIGEWDVGMKTTAGWILIVAVVVGALSATAFIACVFIGGSSGPAPYEVGFYAIVVTVVAGLTATIAFTRALPRESPAAQQRAATLLIIGLAEAAVVLLVALGVLVFIAANMPPAR